MKIYKCNVCGNIVEVLHEGAGKLVCCGQPMELLEENGDVGKEKHVPVVEKTDKGYKSEGWLNTSSYGVASLH